MSAKRLKRTTVAQYEELLQFVQDNKIIIHGKTKPQEAGIIKKLWQQFADHINSLGVGPAKTPEQWKKIYVEWKTNIKRKTREIKTEIRRTGGGTSKSKELTELEQRLLRLISKIHLGSEELPDCLGIQNLEVLSSEQNTVQSNINVPLTSELITMTEVNKTLNDPFIVLNANETLNESFDVEGVDQALNESFSVVGVDQALNESFAILNDSCISSIPVAKNTYQLDAEKPKFQNLSGTKLGTIVKPPTVANIPSNNNASQHKGRKAGHDSRYTNTFIESVANSYNEAQELRYQAAVKNADAIKSLSVAISDFASVYKERVEVEKIKAEAEVVKAQALLIKAKSELMKVQLGYMSSFENM